jgi:hypothetical protein
VVARNDLTALIATFADRRQADAFVAELRRAGFQNDEIGVVTLRGHGTATKVEEGAAVGAVTGGAVGAYVGAVATGLIPGVGPVIAAGGLVAGVLGGAAAGATAGRVVGALVEVERTGTHARPDEHDPLHGRTLVSVQALGRGREALAILHRCQEATDPVRVPTAPDAKAGAAGTGLTWLD